jgi:hypothetical protein
MHYLPRSHAETCFLFIRFTDPYVNTFTKQPCPKPAGICQVHRIRDPELTIDPTRCPRFLLPDSDRVSRTIHCQGGPGVIILEQKNRTSTCSTSYPRAPPPPCSQPPQQKAQGNSTKHSPLRAHGPPVPSRKDGPPRHNGGVGQERGLAHGGRPPDAAEADGDAQRGARVAGLAGRQAVAREPGHPRVLFGIVVDPRITGTPGCGPGDGHASEGEGRRYAQPAVGRGGCCGELVSP